MNIKILLFVIISMIITHAQAEEVEKKDREISVRKAIDSFGKLDEKEITTVNMLRKMFTEGKVSGQIRSIYADYNQKEKGTINIYATAIGGMLKYELAQFNGFNGAVAFTSSQDIGFLTGDKDSAKQNDELSSPKGHYTVLSEAYIHYKNGALNFRAGRQMIDTPLADTDDTRMVPNTFEAYMLTYSFENLVFTAGNVQRWQGAGAGLGYANGNQKDTHWVKAGNRGTWLSGISYHDTMEFNIWYYNISQQDNACEATYIDIGNHTQNGDIRFHASVQYLHESEIDNSGIKADVYGVLLELVVYDIGFNLGYNKSKKHAGKRSFSGIGGGSLYTSMDTMIIDEITEDREAKALVLGLVYDVDNWSFLYAYGDFKGKENSLGETIHRVEQDIGFEYSFNDEFVVAVVYVKEEDKLSTLKTSNDWDRLQVMVKYNF